MSRDNFPKGVTDQVARRASYVCSLCGILTSGPHSDENKSTNYGVAAHITAASIEGPRYDPSITVEERRSIGNAMYVCHNCSDSVDKDHNRFTTEQLRTIKSEHEARLANVRYYLPSTLSIETERARQEIARQNQLLTRLRQLYIASHDNISTEMLTGFEPLPTEWVEATLDQMGEMWRRERY